MCFPIEDNELTNSEPSPSQQTQRPPTQPSRNWSPLFITTSAGSSSRGSSSTRALLPLYERPTVPPNPNLPHPGSFLPHRWSPNAPPFFHVPRPIESYVLGPYPHGNHGPLPTYCPPRSFQSMDFTRPGPFLNPFHPSRMVPNNSYELRVLDVPRKSRVETQVKLRLELIEVSGVSTLESVASSSSAGVDSSLSYGKPVSLWKYVKVPKTASVKVKSKGVCGEFVVSYCLT
jgi:hypothetical protein